MKWATLVMVAWMTSLKASSESRGMAARMGRQARRFRLG